MATQNDPNGYSMGILSLTCDICGSPDIADTKQGYVCKTCGIMLEIQKLEYHRPYVETKIQHEVLSTTKIGLQRERLANPNAYRLEKLNKMHKIKSNDDFMNQLARIEISNIVASLRLSPKLKESLYRIYLRIRKGLESGTKFRNPQKLVPLTLYYHLKVNNIPLDEEKLLEVSKISKKEYNSFKHQIIRFFPNYYQRDRKKFILNRILGIAENFGMGMSFYNESKILLPKLWDVIKNTKDDVIAGLIASIVALCHYKEKVTVNSICSYLNIRMSTIQSQVKEKIFQRFQISGFQSLVRSSDILRKVIENLFRVKEERKMDSEPVKDNALKEGIILSSDIVQIKLSGNVKPVFNSHNTMKYYIFAVRDESLGEPNFISLKVPKAQSLKQIGKEFRPRVHRHIEIESIRYHSGKGPPLISAY